MKCLKCALRERAGHVSNPEADNVSRFVGMIFFIYLYSARNLREKIAVLYVQIILI